MLKFINLLPTILKFLIAAFSVVTTVTNASEVKEISPITDRILLVYLEDGRAISESVDPTNPEGTRDGIIEAVPLDTTLASLPGSWSVSSSDDISYATALPPTKVGRKSKGIQWTRTPDGEKHVLGHWIYLHLPTPLQPGSNYTLDTGNLATGARLRPFRFNPDTLRSETIKVNQIGYVPDGPKFGYLFQYMGDAGSLNLDVFANTRFHIVEDETSYIVFTGYPTLRQRKGDPNTAPDNNVRGGEDFEGTDVYQCDFSEFNCTGRYRLIVERMGSSFPFSIGPDVYRAAFQTTLRGVYHQRSGTALTWPYTQWTRPVSNNADFAPFKPMFQTDITSKHEHYQDGYPARENNRLTGEMRNIPGGYHDAADWDNEQSHIDMASLLCLTYELAPRKFHDGELNIPESGNGIPDILDEATWGVDYYRRMQRPDGSVGVGLFMNTWPRVGWVSWQNPMESYLYAEDADATMRYAQGAAMLAYSLQIAESPAKSKVFLDSALLAWDWAITRNPQNSATLAASAALFRMTGEKRFHDWFKANIQADLGPYYPAKADKSWGYWISDQAWGSWIYLLTNRHDTDKGLQARILNATLQFADEQVLAPSKRRALRQITGWDFGICCSIQTAISSPVLTVAYTLTGDRKYRDALLTGMDFTLGSNSMNLSWVTGLGSRRLNELHNMDAFYRHGGEMPPGLIPLGPGIPSETFSNTFYPEFKEWPGMEQFAKNRYWPMTNEFVVLSSARTAAMFGFLTDEDTTPEPLPLDGTGITGQYFGDASFNNLISTQIDRTVDFYWGTSVPDPRFNSNDFSVRWSGFILPEFSEPHTFSILSDSNVKLWLGENLILNNQTTSAEVPLSAGQRYPIRIEYVRGSDKAQIRLMWSSASTPREIVPHKKLLPK